MAFEERLRCLSVKILPQLSGSVPSKELPSSFTVSRADISESLSERYPDRPKPLRSSTVTRSFSHFTPVHPSAQAELLFHFQSSNTSPAKTTHPWPKAPATHRRRTSSHEGNFGLKLQKSLRVYGTEGWTSASIGPGQNQPRTFFLSHIPACVIL